MLFSDISIVDENFEVQEHKYVATVGRKIAYIGDVPPDLTMSYGTVFNGKGKLLIPAFYNAHSHLPMAYMRGYGENLSLMDWLLTRIFPFEDKMTEEDIYWGCMLGIAEMLRYGIASTSEMYIKLDPLKRAFKDANVKANFCVSITSQGDTEFKDTQQYADTVAAIEEMSRGKEDKQRVEYCLHAEYTNTEKMARSLAQTVKENGGRIHVHVSETEGEVQGCMERHGMSPVRYLESCGIFDLPTTAAHCVHISDEDIAILAAHNVSVATCPKSNAKLASGICPVNKLLEAGVNVALGTDSVASNNNLNMVEEMRFMNLLAKVSNSDPTVLSAAKTLYIATRGGALAQGREDCGLIKEGFKADLVVFDLDKPYLKPQSNPIDTVVYSASGSDVYMTMVDGSVLYREGTYPLLEIDLIEQRVEEAKARILKELA
ncbi:MAG: amidohydrolase [Eggerthellaceae bacterium]|nr:amidohydrolase [Eggerthellaceae bacterium]